MAKLDTKAGLGLEEVRAEDLRAEKQSYLISGLAVSALLAVVVSVSKALRVCKEEAASAFNSSAPQPLDPQSLSDAAETCIIRLVEHGHGITENVVLDFLDIVLEVVRSLPGLIVFGLDNLILFFFRTFDTYMYTVSRVVAFYTALGTNTSQTIQLTYLRTSEVVTPIWNYAIINPHVALGILGFNLLLISLTWWAVRPRVGRILSLVTICYLLNWEYNSVEGDPEVFRNVATATLLTLQHVKERLEPENLKVWGNEISQRSMGLAQTIEKALHDERLASRAVMLLACFFVLRTIWVILRWTVVKAVRMMSWCFGLSVTEITGEDQLTDEGDDIEPEVEGLEKDGVKDSEADGVEDDDAPAVVEGGEATDAAEHPETPTPSTPETTTKEMQTEFLKEEGCSEQEGGEELKKCALSSSSPQPQSPKAVEISTGIWAQVQETPVRSVLQSPVDPKHLQHQMMLEQLHKEEGWGLLSWILVISATTCTVSMVIVAFCALSSLGKHERLYLSGVF